MTSATSPLAAAAIVAALLTACHREASVPPPQGVAQVGEAVISAAQLQQKLADRQRRSPSAPVTVADRDAVLDELVQFEVLFAQAQRAGWHTNAELLASFKRAVVARFQEAQLAKNPATAPSEDEIRLYYEQHAAEFTRAEQTHAAVIVLELPGKVTREKRAEAEAHAAKVREQALQDAAGQPHFGIVAQRHSIDQATRYAGGDFGLLTRGEIEARYGANLALALAAMKSSGEVSAVIETPRGLAIAKLIEHRAASRRPLAEVRGGISYQLTKAKDAQAEREFQASARRGVEVSIHHALLEKIPLPARHEEPPAVPGAETAQINR